MFLLNLFLSVQYYFQFMLLTLGHHQSMENSCSIVMIQLYVSPASVQFFLEVNATEKLTSSTFWSQQSQTKSFKMKLYTFLIVL